VHRSLRLTLAVAALSMALPVKSHAAGPWVQVGWWKLNETGGVALVDSTSGNTGTAYGPTVATDCNAASRCRYFDGVNDFADLPWSAKTQPGTKNFRAVLTIWPAGPKPPAGDDLFRSSGYPNPFWKMEYNDPNPTDGAQPNLGRLNCSFRGSAGQSYVAGGPDLSLGGGHTVECRLLHGAGSGGQDRTELWVDGSRRTYLDTNVGSIQTGVSTIVGAHCCVDAGYFTGWTDDLKLYTATP